MSVEGLGSLVCRAAEEFGLDVVQTLLQQQRTRLLVQRQAQSGFGIQDQDTKLFNITLSELLHIWETDASTAQN